jgi:hypothetical protein
MPRIYLSGCEFSVREIIDAKLPEPGGESTVEVQGNRELLP